MSHDTFPADLDTEKIDTLLKKLEQKILSRDEARDLIPLLQEERKKALSDNNVDLAIDLAHILIGLNAYREGNVNFRGSIPINSNVSIEKLGNTQLEEQVSSTIHDSEAIKSVKGAESSPSPDFEQYSIEQYSNTIASIIRSSHRFSIGVYGEWGAGKTTLMQSIANTLTDDNDIMTVWFNAWRFEREDRFAIVSLMKTLAYKMGEHPLYKELKELFWKGIVSVDKDLAKYLVTEKDREEFKNVPSEGKILATPDKEAIYSDGLKKIEKTMNQIINEHPSARIVVFIDDLDRCAPPTTLEVFESIKMFLDIQGFVCVIGLDYKTISKLIGEQYISKIIQLPIVMPERKSLDIQELKNTRRSILIINK